MHSLAARRLGLSGPRRVPCRAGTVACRDSKGHESISVNSPIRCLISACKKDGSAPAETQSVAQKEAVLCKKYKPHQASLTSAVVMRDEVGTKQVVTASLDKTLANSVLQMGELGASTLEIQQLSPQGAPVFSLVPCSQPLGVGDKKDTTKPSIYCGLASKDIVNWAVGAAELNTQIRMNGHTGWVRSLATSGRWLLSSGCNYLRLWDQSFVVPKEVKSTKLFTGDILGIATGGGKVFTCGADGSLKSWTLSKNGDLEESSQREKAHEQRVVGMVWHKNLVYTVSYDGDLKGWNAENLELVLQAKNAHDGEKIHCLTVGADGILYTGGDDKLIRRWSPAVLEPYREPLLCHNSAVKVLAAGSKECLVSGDADGEVAIWVM